MTFDPDRCRRCDDRRSSPVHSTVEECEAHGGTPGHDGKCAYPDEHHAFQLPSVFPDLTIAILASALGQLSDAADSDDLREDECYCDEEAEFPDDRCSVCRTRDAIEQTDTILDILKGGAAA